MNIEVMKLLALGLVAGVCSGMFGIGGGLIIVPALVLIFGFDTKTRRRYVSVRHPAADRPTRCMAVLEKRATANLGRLLGRGGRIWRRVSRVDRRRHDFGRHHETALRDVPRRRRDLLPAGA